MFMCKVYGMYVYRHVGIENNNKNNFLLLYAYEQYICRLFQLIFFFNCLHFIVKLGNAQLACAELQCLVFLKSNYI